MDCITLYDEEVVKIGRRRVRFGTVSGYSAKYRDDERQAIERALGFGHRLVWLNLEATMLVGPGQPQPDRSFLAELAVGDRVRVTSRHPEEAGVYEIVPAPNGNYDLKRV